jgi:hypothetical protein
MVVPPYNPAKQENKNPQHQLRVEGPIGIPLKGIRRQHEINHG